MTGIEPHPRTGSPTLSQREIGLTRKLILTSSREPLLPTGTITRCQVCGGEMTTTNDLKQSIALATGLITLGGLPGAQCTRCQSVEYDSGAIATILEHSPAGLGGGARKGSP